MSLGKKYYFVIYETSSECQSDKNRKRLIWAVFRDMDKDEETRAWCKDLLDSVLEEYGYINIEKVIFNIASLSELGIAIK